MTDILIRKASVVVTMDGARREVAGGDVLIRDGLIAAVGAGLAAPEATVVEAAGCVVTPGLVNTHHHLYQTLTRAVPGGDVRIGPGRAGGTGAFGLFADVRPPLPVPQRGAAGGYDPCGGRGGVAVPSDARGDVDR